MKFKVRGIDTFASTGGRPFDKNKPLIIFVHGSGLSHMVWVLQTRYFAFRGYSVLAVVIIGVIAMAVNGKLNKNHSNKLMRLRVLFQAIAIFVFVLIVWLARN